MALLEKKVSDLTPIEVEMLKEAASALARSGERLEKALEQLQAAEVLLDESIRDQGMGHPKRAWDALGTEEPHQGQTAPLSREEAIHHYRKALRRAEQARYMYIVQREAIGLRTHRFVDKIFPKIQPRVFGVRS